MTKKDLYISLGMDEYIWGDSFELDISARSIETDKQLFELLDHVCTNENRTPIGENWCKISFEECSVLLQNAFHYDLAYETSEQMPDEKAAYFSETLMNKVDRTNCTCFTNWYNNPWNKVNISGWNPITENTFDMAIVLMDKNTLVFTYFISED